MSKIQSLIKMASYLKEHPNATIPEISSATGMSESYVKECKRDVDELSIYIWKLLLEKNQVDFLTSKLNSSNEFERTILHKLQGVYQEKKDGFISIASPEDAPTMDYLSIAICAPAEDRALVDFWLQYLLYDVLFRIDSRGEMEYRLALSCESVDGYSRWRVELRDDLFWSDGKQVTCDDVSHSIRSSLLTPTVREIRRGTGTEIFLSLAQDDILFPYRLSDIPIFPAHSAIYKVTNGPFILRKSRSSSKTYHFRINKCYYRKNHPKIDPVILKTFERSPFAVRAVAEKRLDVFFSLSLHEIHQYSSALTQNFSFDDLTYWALLVNKESIYLKRKGGVQQLRKSIDYDAINRYLSGGISREIMRPKRSLDIKIGCLSDTPTSEVMKIITFMANCLGAVDTRVVDLSGYPPESAKKMADVALVWIYFGRGYSRLERYFHSKGENNIFGLRHPEVDELIERLDMTFPADERIAIGREIVEKLKEENAIILLAPCLEYIFSNLYVETSPRLNSVTNFIHNLSNITVKRK